MKAVIVRIREWASTAPLDRLGGGYEPESAS